MTDSYHMITLDNDRAHAAAKMVQFINGATRLGAVNALAGA